MEVSTFVISLFVIATAMSVVAILSKKYGVSLLIATFACAIVTTAVVANKLVDVGPFTVSASIIIYSITFIATDTLSEFWGKAVAQNHDVWAYHFWKTTFKGKYLWLRNNLSTGASQILDSFIFVTVAFYGIFPILPIIIGTISLKIVIAVLDTPFLYGIRYVLRKIEYSKADDLNSI